MATLDTGLCLCFFFLFLTQVVVGLDPVNQVNFKVPLAYPKFDQCDPAWANDMMADKTVCKVGCLMTSVSMAIRYYNITINNKEATPGILNQWLRTNGGYDNESDLYEPALDKLSNKIKYIGKQKELMWSDIVDNLNNGTVTIANVKHGKHFVLMVGYTEPVSDSWLVNDPYPPFNQTVYTTDEIVGYRVFTM
ncbi:PREDICTED: uncharacterized protein LOC100641981 [Amphimedon queenslandica]|uniref:Peptidase C39-like domain-containing protein n=1 Tax=Amphimedon queenslandica TaxID=400682 RepID=A0A1X7U5Q0_AMPQE|nr:PREDICTED: uncharacterized protein LOC100641981 [Amphimedon queenslandica]|eukprot:XP_003388977.1 PREDICTED: uncharacterized protein LOC100641981 [Amphimedon queenslandica]